MKLSKNALIAPEKLTMYLLTPKKQNDKSQWLARADYTLSNWRQLENDLRSQILEIDATPTEKTAYGQLFEIVGRLTGPNGMTLEVCTIWMIEAATNITKFITLFPHRSKKQ